MIIRPLAQSGNKHGPSSQILQDSYRQKRAASGCRSVERYDVSAISAGVCLWPDLRELGDFMSISHDAGLQIVEMRTYYVTRRLGLVP